MSPRCMIRISHLFPFKNLFFRLFIIGSIWTFLGFSCGVLFSGGVLSPAVYRPSRLFFKHFGTVYKFINYTPKIFDIWSINDHFDPKMALLSYPQNIGPKDSSWSLYQHTSKPKCISIICTNMVLPKPCGFLGRAGCSHNKLSIYFTSSCWDDDDKEKIWWTCNAVQWLVSCSTA